MRVALEMTLAAECDRCRVVSPVDGLREQVSCRSCASPVDVSGCLGDTAHELTAAEAAHVDNGLTTKQRRMLASGPVCAALVERWAQATDAATRAVAAHIAEPARFLDDPAAEVRAAVAKRQGLTSDAIAKLALDGASAVRAAIAARHDVSVDVLKKLRHDGDPRVAEAAKANPTHHPSLFERLFDR